MVVITSPFTQSRGSFLFPFTYVAKVSYWERLVFATVGVCVFLLLATTLSVPSGFFFFKGFRIPNLLGEGIYMKKKEPTNKVKSKNKDEERNGKGRRKNGGCDQSNFLWRGIALLGLSGSVPGLQLKVNFFYWIPSRDIITSKGYYYPEGFRLNHLSVTFKMQEVTIVWHHGTCQGPSFQTIVYIILPPTLLRWKHWKHFHCRPFYLSRCRGKKKKKPWWTPKNQKQSHAVTSNI